MEQNSATTLMRVARLLSLVIFCVALSGCAFGSLHVTQGVATVVPGSFEAAVAAGGRQVAGDGFPVAAPGFHEPLAVTSLHMEGAGWHLGALMGPGGVRIMSLRHTAPLGDVRPHFDAFVEAIRLASSVDAAWDALLASPELRFEEAVPGHYWWTDVPANDPEAAVLAAADGELLRNDIRYLTVLDGLWSFSAQVPSVVVASQHPEPDFDHGEWSLELAADDLAVFEATSSEALDEARWAALVQEAFQRIGLPAPPMDIADQHAFSS